MVNINKWREFMKWRWEFMRRNSGYIKDYKNALKLRKKANYNENNIISYSRTIEGKKEKAYCEKWIIGTTQMFNPDNSFEELNKKSGTVYERRQKLTFSEWIAQMCATDINGLGSNVFSFVHNKKELTINIDFKNVNSLAELKNIVNFTLEACYKDWCSNKPKTYLIDYDILLKVGDMKQKGLTNEKIAKKLFPRDFQIDNENAKSESKIRQISNYYKRYKELVNGGYKEITFP